MVVLASLKEESFAQFFRRGARVYLPGCAGHSPVFERWLTAHPQLAASAWFSGVWIPGVNKFDPTALHPTAKATAFFPGALPRARWLQGQLEYLPLRYSEVFRFLAEPGRFDLLLLHLSPPDAMGRCSFSVACDFSPGVTAGSPDALILAHFNPRLPRTRGPWIHVDRIYAAIEEDVAPLTLDERTLDATSKSIARRVANEVNNGATLQVGIGKLGSAIWSSLRYHANLRIHTGMVSDGILALIRSGALEPSNSTPPITTGVALGSQELYEALAEPTLCRFAGTGTTHNFAVISGQRSMIAINSALEVDLLGQVNAESLDGKLISGIGGLADFARAAQAGEDGRSIIALPSTTSKGVSRIVVRLGAGAVPISRTDTDLVCTEHGIARVRHLGMNARAIALIAIAHPNHREHLTRDWRVLREQL